MLVAAAVYLTVGVVLSAMAIWAIASGGLFRGNWSDWLLAVGIIAFLVVCWAPMVVGVLMLRLTGGRWD